MLQGSKEWLEWRGKGIGSSEAPILMGDSPWKTKYQLWLEKTGRKASEVSSYVMYRGHENEKIARAHYELLTGMVFEPTTMESGFFRASLDGYNEELGIVLEIKCPGKDDHEAAAHGRIPQKYYAQVQWLLMVSGAKVCHYYSYHNESASGHLIVVEPCQEYIVAMRRAATEFWDMVKNDKPPQKTNKDVKEELKENVQEITDPGLCSLMERYGRLQAQLNEASAGTKAVSSEMESIRKEIENQLKPTEFTHFTCGGYAIRKQTREGQLDAKALEKDFGKDTLAKYKKPGTTYCVISKRSKDEI